MLSLTRKADYALVAAVYLARRRREQAGPASAREVAQTFGMPAPLLMNVLKQLAATGLVASTRGAGGGYELAVDPAGLTLRRVVDALDEQDHHPQPHHVLRRLHGRLDRFLEHATVGDLLDTAGPGAPAPLANVTWTGYRGSRANDVSPDTV